MRPLRLCAPSEGTKHLDTQHDHGNDDADSEQGQQGGQFTTQQRGDNRADPSQNGIQSISNGTHKGHSSLVTFSFQLIISAAEKAAEDVTD